MQEKNKQEGGGMVGDRDIPAIETGRLRLRGHRVEDLDQCAAMWAAREVTRHTTGKPQTREEVWTRLLRYRGHWALLGFGYWAIEEKSSGKFVGEIGFQDLKREIEPSIEAMAEAGWILAPQAHGKGYATEGLRAVIAWGERNLPTIGMVCIIDPANEASIRVAGKCGFREIERTSYHGQPTILFKR